MKTSGIEPATLRFVTQYHLLSKWLNYKHEATLQDVSEGYKCLIKSDFNFQILDVLGDREG
jgi:hypothetical protein